MFEKLRQTFAFFGFDTLTPFHPAGDFDRGFVDRTCGDILHDLPDGIDVGARGAYTGFTVEEFGGIAGLGSPFAIELHGCALFLREPEIYHCYCDASRSDI